MPKTTTGLRRRQLDTLLTAYQGFPKFARGYIREIRDALGMSSTQLAARMGITQAAVISMESNEQEESISLKTLHRAADALECDLVYALVPKKSLDQVVIDQAHIKATEQAKNIFRSMGLEHQSTSQEARDQLLNDLAQRLILGGGRELWK